ncbi:MAG TPA: zinc-ribbon domain-containing protein [Candidatus Krumholzibacteria bacterium]|nr:zinc-ribbon domain-containing protein [Candidatus Krumholzibacteria bacterium]HPD72792.1 zinc-ribbon domain-containing protein [Candidatus Krumholzibacteria bacterium]HRY40276.1 zinc-ribbon domain-containing protein [Candidatus Krumholzibacteria bacterium]
MITTCTGCHVRYRLDAAKVPPRQIRVRCPDCGTVFTLDGTRRDDSQVEAPQAAAGSRTPDYDDVGIASGPVDRSPAGPSHSGSLDLDLGPAPAAAAADTVDRALSPARGAPRTPPRAAPSAAVAGQPAGSPTAVAELPGAARRRRRDKTDMLARALVSDILVYNREARDKALAAGNLLEALGPEIKKSWELYKEKVGAEAATGTTHFKDALNEILADGKQVF